MKQFLCAAIFLMVVFVSAQTNVFVISYSTTPSACQKGSALLSITGGTGNVSVQWEDGSFGIWKNELDAGNYQLTITDSVGNDTAFTLVIDAAPCFMQGAPSFTPNGDGINDVWFVSNAGYYDEFLIQVYNRWGQKVFEATSDMQGWDGTWKGQPVPDGTYYYILEFNDRHFGKQKKNGSITILR
jgi:gliding motility-associated-like protein